MKPGDMVETPDGPGELLRFEHLVIRDRHGRPRDETGFLVKLPYPDGRTILYMPGTVYPSGVFACHSEDVDESGGVAT